MFTKIQNYIVYALLIILPFHALIITFTNQYIKPNYLQYWKEVFLVILFLIYLYQLYQSKWKIHIIEALIFSYILFLSLHSMLIGIPLYQILLGLRYDTIFLLFYIICTRIIIDQTFVIKNLIHASFIITIFSFLFYFILPIDWLAYLGYSSNISAWIPMKDSLPIFHGFGENLQYMRAQGTFASPNYFALYIGTIIYLIIPYIKSPIFKNIYLYYLCFLIFIFILTFSRSAIIGILVSVIIFVFFNIKYKYKKIIITSVPIILTILAILFVSSTDRISSTIGHVEAINTGLQHFIANPYGYGLGYAGPVSRYVDTNPYKKGLIVENWGLQIALEGGILAIIMWISILIMIIYNAYKNKNIMLYPLLISIIMAMFLHIYEDSSSSLFLFGLISLLNNKNETNHSI